MAFTMMVKVRVSGAPLPLVGSRAATPNMASISLVKAQTFNTALVWAIEGFTGEVSANMEWYMDSVCSRVLGYRVFQLKPRKRVMNV